MLISGSFAKLVNVVNDCLSLKYQTTIKEEQQLFCALGAKNTGKFFKFTIFQQRELSHVKVEDAIYPRETAT